MVLSEMIKFLRYGDPTLYHLLSQFHITQREDHLAWGPKNLVPNPPALEKVSTESRSVTFSLTFGLKNEQSI